MGLGTWIWKDFGRCFRLGSTKGVEGMDGMKKNCYVFEGLLFDFCRQADLRRRLLLRMIF
jgi:hypothetical protein